MNRGVVVWAFDAHWAVLVKLGGVASSHLPTFEANADVEINAE